MPAKIPKQKVLNDIQRVAEELGKTPSRSQYRKRGEYADITARNKFGSWTKAKRAAGLEDVHTENNVPIEKIKAEIVRVAESIGESPSQAQFNEHSKYSHQLAYDRFGSWNDALRECNLKTRLDDRIPDSKLLDDIKDVGERIEAVPSQSTYREHGRHGLTVVKRRFGKWSTAVRKAGFEPHTVGPQTGEGNPAWKGGYDPYYGPRWYSQRRRARRRDEYECRDCGATDKEHLEKYGWELEVHHIIPVRKYDNPDDANDLDNLVTLCRTHHRRYERLPNQRAKELIE